MCYNSFVNFYQKLTKDMQVFGHMYYLPHISECSGTNVNSERRQVMKTRARLLSIVLAAVTVIGSAIPAFAAPAEGGYQIELNQVGSFSQ
jgi:hypothetical protein